MAKTEKHPITPLPWAAAEKDHICGNQMAGLVTIDSTKSFFYINRRQFVQINGKIKLFDFQLDGGGTCSNFLAYNIFKQPENFF